MRRKLNLCALAMLVVSATTLSACASRSRTVSSTSVVRAEDNIADRIDRGDWMVNRGSKVFKVMAHGQANRPPQHVGFVEQRAYRQRRGGPEFTMYQVSTQDRKEQVGHIDQMGRAYRYEPQRNGTFNKVALGTSTLELSVQGILNSSLYVTFEATTERRLAFEALDANSDGKLENAETSSFGSRIAEADRNRDGAVDFEEFKAIEVL
jgi:hypothetical protein